jgi:hypothetical protein
VAIGSKTARHANLSPIKTPQLAALREDLWDPTTLARDIVKARKQLVAFEKLSGLLAGKPQCVRTTTLFALRPPVCRRGAPSAVWAATAIHLSVCHRMTYRRRIALSALRYPPKVNFLEESRLQREMQRR